ncbi:hypothetical protein GOP47_0023499 [Adiantum capillus-veneris]|uniref:Protein kinase domain-containing protein n=1 Tax=Adiantum capillus-veneris TaxID=13818 RepID=A0A9D4U3I7_ADICA|nr:hypothetical protein GOP47_0023499 [Adiantum capillus-veneris]
MAGLLQLLHFFLLLIMSSKAVCQDSEHGGHSFSNLENASCYPGPCSSVKPVSIEENYLQGGASSAILPNVLEFISFMLGYKIRHCVSSTSLAAPLPSCLEGISSQQQEEHAIQQLPAKPVKNRFHTYSRARSLLSEAGQRHRSSRAPPPVYPAPPQHEMPPPPMPNVKHPISSAPPPTPAHKKHHRRHHHFAPPPPKHRQVKRSPPPTFHSLAPPPSPPRSRSPPRAVPTRRSPPHFHRHSNAPRSTPPGHLIAPPPLASPKSPLVPVITAPMPSSQPPPIEDCGAVVCLPPLTKTAFMSPCGCVRPIQVQIQLTVPLYSLFPSISVLAANIADGIVLAPSQVEITGANADSQNPDYSIVVVNLVPLDQEFDNLTAFLIFQKFWNHEVALNASLFGNYSVAYVHYPGLPPSPPSQIDNGGLNGTNGKANQEPFGVDVNQKSHKLGIEIIVVIAVSSAIALVACLGALWFLFRRYSHSEVTSPKTEPGMVSTRTKRSGGRSLLFSDLGSSSSMSLSSSMATYASTARTFTLAELEKATDNFRIENVVGEGGFGRVYCGILDDGTKIAVKVLTRDQGGKEFISEVEMLSRLHHRNLVKLIGICTEEHTRCLVYDLIPNGSVESHLHGVDKESSPLDWEARMKIALGAARGLAYLHEDSNPRVIHRDFKASNILLENDFTPKVSDFGLAKVAPDEGREHLSTRVMGTFGYVAPEYAMTGHLLVKSDVYSYGVVLLELLSGRQPVDILKPPGQANLVTWARPLLTSREGVELLVDPALGRNFPFDNLVRVAAIASMCVHPEVSHRPFMGEVVQALKLVYNDTEVHNEIGSSNASQEDDSFIGSADAEQVWLNQKTRYTLDGSSFISIDYDSGPSQVGDAALKRPLSASALFPDSLRFMRQKSKSFRRHSMSGPLRPQTSRVEGYKLRAMNKQGSMSEHVALSSHFGTGLNRDFLGMLP